MSVLGHCAKCGRLVRIEDVVADAAQLANLPAGGRTVGELIFVVKNNRKEPVTVWPFQGEMGLLEEEPPYEKPVIIGTFGDYINGDLPPGFSGTGGFWFTFKTHPSP